MVQAAQRCGVPVGTVAEHDERRGSFRERAQIIERLLDDAESGGDQAWSALGRIYDHLGDSGAEARILEQRLSRVLRSGTLLRFGRPDSTLRGSRATPVICPSAGPACTGAAGRVGDQRIS